MKMILLMLTLTVMPIIAVVLAERRAAVGQPSTKADVPARPSEELMENRQVAALTEMKDAVNAGDAGRYARAYAPDAVITIHGGVELKGRSSIEQYEVELMREFPGTRFAFYAIWLKGPQAVVHYAVKGKTPSGKGMGHEGLLFYRFQSSGLIEEEHRYLDSMTPMAQMGMLGTLTVRPPPRLPTDTKVHMAKESRTERQNVAMVRASVAALNSRNELAFLSAIAEDAVLDELINPQPVEGKRNVKAWFEAWTGAVPDARFEINTILGIGDFVLTETVLRGTLKGPLGGLSASNRGFVVHRAMIAQVKNETFARISAFMNGKELAEAVGQWPPPIVK